MTEVTTFLSLCHTDLGCIRTFVYSITRWCLIYSTENCSSLHTHKVLHMFPHFRARSTCALESFSVWYKLNTLKWLFVTFEFILGLMAKIDIIQRATSEYVWCSVTFPHCFTAVSIQMFVYGKSLSRAGHIDLSMSTVIHTVQGVRVWGWVCAVSPAWAKLKFKLEIELFQGQAFVPEHTRSLAECCL